MPQPAHENLPVGLALFLMASHNTIVPWRPECLWVQGQVCALLEEASLGMHAWRPPHQAASASAAGPGRPRWVPLYRRPHCRGCPG